MRVSATASARRRPSRAVCEDAEAALEELGEEAGARGLGELRERYEAGRVELRRLRLECSDERRQQRRAVLREDVRRRHRGVVLRGLVAGLKERRRERRGERRVDEREASGRLRGGGEE